MAQTTQPTPDTSDQKTTYNFGALERRGVILGLSVAQTLVLLVGSATTVLFLAAGGGLGIATLCLTLAAGLVFLRRQGRPLVHWVDAVLLYGARRLLGRTRWRSRAPWQGTHVRIPISDDGQPNLASAHVTKRPCDTPDAIGPVEILETDFGSGQALGVVADREKNTFTCAFRCESRPFALESRSVQERMLANWGAWFSGIARTATISRLQWIERTVVSGTDDIERFFEENRDQRLSEDSAQIQSYRQLIETAGAVSREHELLVALQIKRGNPAVEQRVRRHGKSDAAVCHVLSVEARAVIDRLRRADLTSTAPLSAEGVACAIKDAFDPFSRPARHRLIEADPKRDGIAPELAWPLATDETAHSYRSDSALHRTMWLGEWPRLDVEPAFLLPLLLQTEGLRTVSVVFEPVPPRKSLRKAEGAVLQDVTDEAIRDRFGFLTTARRRKEQEGALRREQELVAGHAEVRMAGFLTVSVAAEQDHPADALDNASAAAQDTAQLSLLEPDSRPGEQAQAFACGALPLCRGLS